MKKQNKSTTSNVVNQFGIKNIIETSKDLVDFIGIAAKESFTFDVFERGIYTKLMNLGKQCVECFLKEVGKCDMGSEIKLSDRSYLKKLPINRERILQSVFGVHSIDRIAYGTREGQAIECVPLDTRLQLPKNEHSYFLQELGQSLSVEMSYKTAKETLEKFLPNIHISVNGLEQINRVQGNYASVFIAQQEPPDNKSEAELLVISSDGKGVPIRHSNDTSKIDEHHTKRGTKPDRKKMAVVGAVYTIDPFKRTPEDILDALFSEPKTEEENEKSKRPIPQNKRVTAYLTCKTNSVEHKAVESAFTWLNKEVDSRDIDNKKLHISITDGQPSLLQERKRKLSGEWIDILDLLHANSYLWEAASIFYSNDSIKQQVFMKENVYKILCGKVEKVVSDLKERSINDKISKKRCNRLEKICSYFTKNAHRMKYDVYLKAGYPIASGIIEGACLHLVKDRMEGTGMHWTITGAQAMLNMRSIAINGDWEEFTKYRMADESRRLYPHTGIIGKTDWIIAA